MIELNYRAYCEILDKAFLLNMYADNQVMEFIPNVYRFRTPQAIAELLNHPNLIYFYSIVDVSTTKIIGQACIYIYPNSTDAYELAYIIDKPYWGKGVGKNTIDFLINVVFSTLSGHQVYCRMSSDNLGSQKLSHYAKMDLVNRRWVTSELEELTYMLQR